MKIDKVELARKILEKENFIILFYSEYCETCEKQKKLLDSHKINYFSICCDDDEDFFIDWYKIDIIPVLQVYRFGNMVWSKENILSQEDLGVVSRYDSVNNSEV